MAARRRTQQRDALSIDWFAGRPIRRNIFIRSRLWQALCRDARHPIAAHFRRQLKQGRRVSILPLSLAVAIVLLFMFFNAYNLIDYEVMWSLPLWLMLASLAYCAVWIVRIAALMSRQAEAGVMDEIGLIPPGRTYVYLVIGKIVLNEGDGLAWCTVLRRYSAGIIFACLCMALFIAAAQIERISLLDAGAFLAALALVTLLITLEHAQSVVLAFLTAVIVCMRVQGPIDRASIAVVCFALLQVLTWSLAIAFVAVVESVDLSFMFVLFLVIRDLLIAALWRAVLRWANEDDFLPGPLDWSKARG